MNINLLKRNILKFDIVSFDIFDTLLIRPYIKPTDLFLHMEKALNYPGFADERKDAERRARIRHSDLEDITFDMIYDEIDDEFKGMKQKEMDWEEMVLRANPEMKQVYDYAKAQGKKIVIASDMYLPTKFIAKVLKKNGYDAWDKLYVSGDFGKTKGHGSLWFEMQRDLNVKSKHILHIGDNKYSDYKKPKKFGIKTVRYISIFNQFININKNYKKLKNNYCLGLSIILSIMAYKWIVEKCLTICKRDYWEDLGYLYAGPVAYGYTRFIEKTVKENKIEAILFVARDGYLLQKIFNIFKTKVKSVYVYAPRFLNHICRIDYVKNNTQQAQAIIDFYKKEFHQLYLSKSITNPCEFIQRNKKRFLNLATKQMQIYRNYLLNKIPNAKKYALVDTVTGAFSSQKLLQSSLQKEILGIYWGICREDVVNQFNQCSFVGVHHGQVSNYFTKNWNFIEFLISSPEYPIKNIDASGKIVHVKQENHYEIKRAKLYQKIEKGALAFVKDIETWFSGNNIFLSNKDIINWIDSYIDYPTKTDMYNMSDICISEDSMHSKYIPLFWKKINLWDFLKSPKKVIKEIKKMHWRTVFQSILLCVKRPISIHTKGLKRINIAVLPYLRKRYFNLSLGNSSSFCYAFVIGNIKENKYE